MRVDFAHLLYYARVRNLCMEGEVATTPQKPVLHCSFCTKSQSQVRRLIAGPEGHICDECVSLASDILREETRGGKTSGAPKSLLRPSQILDFLNQYVIGQPGPKRTLAVAVSRHYRRLNAGTPDIEVEKSNIVLVGPTGSGKTFLAMTLARMLSVPFASGDATKMTEAGYVGDDVEIVLQKLLQNAGGDVEKAEWGIVYIDEIDKVATGTGAVDMAVGRDPSGRGVQQGLLKIIEGTVATFPADVGKRTGNETVQMDTRNILFILGGAFDGIGEVVAERLAGGSSIGFAAKEFRRGKQVDPYAGVTHEDLVKYGLIPELVGRIPVIAKLHELSEDDLVRILREPRNALEKQIQYEVSLIGGVAVEFTPGASHLIARMALASKTGARGLRAIMESVVEDLFFELPDEVLRGEKKPVKVVIDEEAVTTKKAPRLIVGEPSA